MGNNLNHEEQEILNQGKTRRNRKEPELPNFGSPGEEPTESRPYQKVSDVGNTSALAVADTLSAIRKQRQEKLAQIAKQFESEAEETGFILATLIETQDTLVNHYTLKHLEEFRKLREQAEQARKDWKQPGFNFESYVEDLANKVIRPFNEQKALTGDLLGM